MAEIYICQRSGSFFGEGRGGVSRRAIEEFHLAQFDAHRLKDDGWEYELTFRYRDETDQPGNFVISRRK
jgi:hypothetical protein